jgi:uncharacterized membrane protein YphA (DoxX/SURF4 family)
MEMFYQFGLTQRILEAAIIFGGAAILIAALWRYLILGAGVILVVYIFMHHEPQSANAKPIDDMAKIEAQKKEFMEDCLSIAMNDKFQCDVIWRERQQEER